LGSTSQFRIRNRYRSNSGSCAREGVSSTRPLSPASPPPSPASLLRDAQSQSTRSSYRSSSQEERCVSSRVVSLHRFEEEGRAVWMGAACWGVRGGQTMCRVADHTIVARIRPTCLSPPHTTRFPLPSSSSPDFFCAHSRRRSSGGSRSRSPTSATSCVGRIEHD
jgi:hypothetical protein